MRLVVVRVCIYNDAVDQIDCDTTVDAQPKETMWSKMKAELLPRTSPIPHPKRLPIFRRLFDPGLQPSLRFKSQRVRLDGFIIVVEARTGTYISLYRAIESQSSWHEAKWKEGKRLTPAGMIMCPQMEGF